MCSVGAADDALEAQDCAAHPLVAELLELMLLLVLPPPFLLLLLPEWLLVLAAEFGVEEGEDVPLLLSICSRRCVKITGFSPIVIVQLLLLLVN